MHEQNSNVETPPQVEPAVQVHCLHQYIEYYADKYPDREAILGNYDSYTYEELELKTNVLARYLRKKGVGVGSFVGIYFNRSEFPIIATVAILKAGACYIPLDPAYPKERIEHIVDDCGISVILTEQALLNSVPETIPCEVLPLDLLDGELSCENSQRITLEESGLTESDLCYIIYTSGSTGAPKGILTEHRNVVFFTNSFRKICKLTYADRVYQGFSMGFDGSIEEIWQCFSSGATLVTSTDASAKLASEAAHIIREKEVTFFSTVPTFLSLIDGELPSVRLLILSGEPCRTELVEKWATENRCMLNVYGPTETTVNTTSERCIRGKEITIGKPLDGYEVYILNEKLEEVTKGETGELYIGGAGLARGYHKQEKLTEELFIQSPFHRDKRLYKTGDKVSYNEHGELLFHGRIDNQVKVRGYRIELSEIESVLLDFDMVQSAAVVVVEKAGMKHLSAFATAVSKEIDCDALLDFCSDRLPSYMIPSFFSKLETMPTTASGKVNRKALPEVMQPFIKKSREIVTPNSKDEELLYGLWQDIFHVDVLSTKDNFFTDLGGYSLLAAELVSQLRANHGIDLPIRLLYDNPTIFKLAPQLEEHRKNKRGEEQHSSSKEVYEEQSGLSRFLVQTMQGCSLALLWGIRAVPLVILFHFWYPFITGATDAVKEAIVATALLTLLWWPTVLTFSILSKWILIGRYRERSIPLWSWTYFRFWLSSKLQGLVGLRYLCGTPVLSLYYRLMGAKIGRGVILDTDAVGAYDLISIGDDSSVSSESQILAYTVKDGMVHFAPISIGKECFVGIHSTLAPGAIMEDGAILGDLSLLEEKAVAKAHCSYQGAPAIECSFELPQVEETPQRAGFFMGVLHFIAALCISLCTWGSNIPSLLLLYWGWGTHNWYIFSGAIIGSVPLSILSYCLVVPVLKWCIMAKTKPGSYSVNSLWYLRKWMVDLLMRSSRSYMHAIYTTIYLAPWLRLMGAKIGKMAEISTVSQVTPDLIHIEDESFFADGSMIGGRHFYRGFIRCAENHIKQRSFVGNNAILPMGATLSDNCLLGVLSYPPEQVVPKDSEWLGSPSFQLPHRVKVEGFSDEEVFCPTPKLFVQRYVIDGMRILLPGYISLISLTLFYLLLTALYGALPLLGTVLLLPLLSLGSVLLTLIQVIGCKWAVMKKIKPEVKPLWCTYIWWNELVNGVHETVGAPIVASMGGTPYIHWYFRLLGSKIGKGVYMDTTLFSEFDMVHIGDYCALNQGVVVQNHLFEDRIFKSSYAILQDEVSMGNMAIILYDAEVGARSTIAPLSLVMKGEKIPAESSWSGIPVVRK